jgi:RimJ/RimL family protein N-acetyltransferase
MDGEYAGQQVRLRPLKDDDLDTVLRLFRSTPNYFAAIGYGRDPYSKLQLQRDFEDAHTSDGRVMYAITRCDDGTLVGVADVRLETTMSDTATIALLLIGGPYQQQGYGSEAAALLEQALWADPDVDFIMAGVAESSTLGQQFWQRRGYQPSGMTTHDPQTSRSTVWLALRRESG